MPRRVDLVRPPKHGKTKVTADSVITGFGSVIDIPRTELAKGAKFGEAITPQALRFAVRREPVAKRVVYDVAEDVFEKWFEVRPIKAGGEQPDLTLNEKVQAEFEKLHAKTAFIKAAEYERLYGWSIIVLGLEDSAGSLDQPAANVTRVDHLAVYSPRAVSVLKEDTEKESDRFGLPVLYEVNRGHGDTIKVHHSRVLHVATRLDEHPYQGVSVLEHIWDDMTVYRNLRWALGQVYWRMAGLMVFTLPADTSDAAWQEFISKVGDPNARTFLMLPDDKKVEILSAAGRVLDPNQFIDPILRSISIGTGIPKQKLEGAEAGALASSETNQRDYYKYISGQQVLYEDQMVAPLIDLMMDIGQLPDFDYNIEWHSAFELDIATEAAAKLADAQTAREELRYRTVDEVRGSRGDKPLAEATGGRIDGQIFLPLLELQSRPQAPAGTADAEAELGRRNILMRIRDEIRKRGENIEK